MPMENTVLTLMAHPDDAEILCGGTLALLARRGWAVHIATVAQGDCGSATLSGEEIAAIRRREAEAAAALLGGRFHCLGRRDLLVRYEPDSLRDAVGLLRRVRPRILLTHSPADYMLDHEQASLIARAAAFGAPMPNAPAPHGTTPCESVPHLYYADPVEGKDNYGREVLPAVMVDVGSVFETRIRMLAAHSSQREWLRRHHGVDEYLDASRRWARARGRLGGCEYGEGFRQHLGHGYPQDDLLAKTLEGHVSTTDGTGERSHHDP